MSSSNSPRNINSDSQETEKNQEKKEVNEVPFKNPLSIKKLYPSLSFDGKISKNLLLSNEEEPGFKRNQPSFLMDEKENNILSENFLKEFNMYEVKKEPSNEPVSLNLHQLLNRLMAETFTSIGKTAAEMKRGDKIQFIKQLDKQGAFDITKSGERVAEALNISKCTFYNYLDKARIK